MERKSIEKFHKMMVQELKQERFLSFLNMVGDELYIAEAELKIALIAIRHDIVNRFKLGNIRVLEQNVNGLVKFIDIRSGAKFLIGLN